MRIRNLLDHFQKFYLKLKNVRIEKSIVTQQMFKLILMPSVDREKN